MAGEFCEGYSSGLSKRFTFTEHMMKYASKPKADFTSECYAYLQQENLDSWYDPMRHYPKFISDNETCSQ